MVDRYIGQLDEMGAAIVLTADHGMKPKHDASGAPAVVYIQDLLDDWLGKAAARVILPITDPYVVHHGALGSFATAYLPDNARRQEIISRIRKLTASCLPSTRRTRSAGSICPRTGSAISSLSPMKT